MEVTRLFPFRRTASLINEDAVLGNGKETKLERLRICNLLGDRKGVPGQLQIPGIKGLRHQTLLPEEQQITGRRIDGITIRFEKELGVLAVDRSNIDSVAFGRAGTARFSSPIEEVTAVRQKCRPAQAGLMSRFVGRQNRCGGPARSGHACEPSVKIR